MPSNSATPQANTGIPGLPPPNGFDESTGQPYWLDQQGQKLYWQQMQQLMWMAQQQRETKTSGKGPEGINMPSMPQIYTGASEAGLEHNIERGPRNPERNLEQQPNQQAEKPKQVEVQAPNNSKSGSAASYLGDSPKLTKVSTSDVESMRNFAQTNATAPTSSSNRFLAELVKKVIHMLSVKHS
jgi:hypothetical protein